MINSKRPGISNSGRQTALRDVAAEIIAEHCSWSVVRCQLFVEEYQSGARRRGGVTALEGKASGAKPDTTFRVLWIRQNCSADNDRRPRTYSFQRSCRTLAFAVRLSRLRSDVDRSARRA